MIGIYRLVQAIILMPAYMAKQERTNHELLVNKVSEVFEEPDNGDEIELLRPDSKQHASSVDKKIK